MRFSSVTIVSSIMCDISHAGVLIILTGFYTSHIKFSLIPVLFWDLWSRTFVPRDVY